MFEKASQGHQPRTPSCEDCPIIGLEGTAKRTPASIAAEYAMYLWRRDFSKGDGIDDVGERQSIEAAGIKPEDAETVYGCMLSRYRRDCEPTNNRD